MGLQKQDYCLHYTDRWRYLSSNRFVLYLWKASQIPLSFTFVYAIHFGCFPIWRFLMTDSSLCTCNWVLKQKRRLTTGWLACSSKDDLPALSLSECLLILISGADRVSVYLVYAAVLLMLMKCRTLWSYFNCKQLFWTCLTNEA